MLAVKPPLGWNTWNTFGANINENLILEMAEHMVSEGYLAAGYDYIVIDDCWSLKYRDKDGRLIPDPEKFPHGIRCLADQIHEMGLKLGIYSCSGARTCAGYPSSYDHEFVDAETFAEWGIDFLKYDFCNFPATGDCINRYHMMSMALKSTGRDILFSACNWGSHEPWKWMSSIGAHMYRSTGDIMDNFTSFTNIFKSQIGNLCMSGVSCFNDMDMLTVGMGGKGNVGFGDVCTYEEYRMQFSMWCLAGVPLMLGADLRGLSEEYRALLTNRYLLDIDQDEECRPPYLVRKGSVFVSNTDPQPGEFPWKEIPDTSYVFLRHLKDRQFALAFINLANQEAEIHCEFADLGLPPASGTGLRLHDVFKDEDGGLITDSFNPRVKGHDMQLYLCTLEKV